MLTLHNLKKFSKSTKKRKRVGRGNASGHGTYATRGMKGQRSRTGGRKGLLKKGFKVTLQRLPKNKGQKSFKTVREIINLDDLEKNFANGFFCQIKDYYEKGLIKDLVCRVKILGDGQLTKKLKVAAHNFSKKAKAAIIKAGGEIIILGSKKINVGKN